MDEAQFIYVFLWFVVLVLLPNPRSWRFIYSSVSGFPGGSVVKNLPTKQEMLAKQEMRVWSQGWEDSLEKEMATHSSIPAWEIPWTEESAGLQSRGSQRFGYNLAIKQQQLSCRILVQINWDNVCEF